MKKSFVCEGCYYRNKLAHDCSYCIKTGKSRVEEERKIAKQKAVTITENTCLCYTQ